MKINKTKPDNTVSIRMNCKEWQSLRDYMHVKNSQLAIVFSYGARLVKRGYGWYRLESNNTIRASDKIAYALTVLKHFIKDLCPPVVEGARCTAYCGYTESWHFIADPVHNSPPSESTSPASLDKLHLLVAKYSHAVNT